MGKAEWRKPYNFRKEVKRERRRIQKNRCGIEGCNEKHGLQAHHILGARVAFDKFRNLDYELVRSIENCIYLCETHHRLVHEELRKKPKDQRLAYYKAMYEHLLESMRQLALI